MRRALRRRLAAHDGEAGLTMMEVLVATVMSVIVVGGAMAMLISAVRAQPEQNRRAESISTARWQLDRMTHEVRNGVSVTTAEPARVSFVARVHRTTCGGPPSAAALIKCQITYTCATATKSCTRVEAAEGVFAGPSTAIATGIDTSSVFCYVPSAETDPTKCGAAKAGTAPTYVGITLHVPYQTGGNGLTVSDGASLRTATFTE